MGIGIRSSLGGETALHDGQLRSRARRERELDLVEARRVPATQVFDLVGGWPEGLRLPALRPPRAPEPEVIRTVKLPDAPTQMKIHPPILRRPPSRALYDQIQRSKRVKLG